MCIYTHRIRPPPNPTIVVCIKYTLHLCSQTSYSGQPVRGADRDRSKLH